MMTTRIALAPGRRVLAAAGRLAARPLSAAMVVATMSFAACGSSDAAADARSPIDSMASGGTAGSGSTSDRARSSDDRIEATLSGPAFGGKHEVRHDMECAWTAGIWQALLETNRTRGLSGAMVMLQDVPRTGGTTDNANLTLTFGQVTDEYDANAGMVQLFPQSLGGDARGSITREGDGAVLRIEGTTQGAGAVIAVVHCASVNFVD